MSRSVSIHTTGRSGTVTYHEDGRSIDCYWEFGGADDVLAIVQCGTAPQWARHPWALDRRAEILRFIADEVIRQQAPTCRADIDADRGDILLRPTASQATAPPPRVVDFNSWFTRLSMRRARLGRAVMLGALALSGVMCVRRDVMIDPGNSVPIGYSLRTDRYVATLMQTLVPYIPSPNRDHSKDMYRISVLLLPLDGSAARMVPIEGSVSGSVFGLAKILGVDGNTLWFRAGEIGAIDLSTFTQVRDADAGGAAALQRSAAATPFGPKPEHHLAAGLFTSPTEWLGAHATPEVERDFKPARFLKRVVRAESAKLPRRLYRGTLDADSSAGYHRILTMTPLGDAEYLNAAFVRLDEKAEPIRLGDPAGVLMVYTSAPGLNGTLMVARVNLDGTMAWSRDTGIDRFTLQQILPGDGSTVFVGPRPPVPGKVSEPLMVIVPHATGEMRVESLWR